MQDDVHFIGLSMLMINYQLTLPYSAWLPWRALFRHHDACQYDSLWLAFTADPVTELIHTLVFLLTDAVFEISEEKRVSYTTR